MGPNLNRKSKWSAVARAHFEEKQGPGLTQGLVVAVWVPPKLLAAKMPGAVTSSSTATSPTFGHLYNAGTLPISDDLI